MPNIQLDTDKANLDLTNKLTTIELTAQQIADAIKNASTIITVDNALDVRLQKPLVNDIFLTNDVSASITDKDFALMERLPGGQQVLAISSSVLTNSGDSSITFNNTFKPSFTAEYGLSISQRIRGKIPYLEIIDTDNYVETFLEFNITAISQSTTTLTVTIDQPFDGSLGYLIDIYGLQDSRFNYSNLCVNNISTNKQVLTFTYNDDNALPTLTATASNVVGGKLKCQSLHSNNFIKFRYSGLSTTLATLLARFNTGYVKVAGALTGQQSSTIGSSALVYANNANGQVELKPTTRPKIIMDEDQLTFLDSLIDQNNALDISRATFTEVKPSFFKNYKNRMRINTSISASKVIAKIINVARTGTTTVTVTTDRPHGLIANASYVSLMGVKNNTAFPNTTSVVTSIISPTVFTIVLGTASTTTSYGGLLVLVNGSQSLPGVLGIFPTTISRSNTGITTIIGSATWSGLNIGDYIDLYGCLDAGGVDLNVDGAYRVHNISGTTLLLEPIKNIDNTYVLNANSISVTPVGDILTNVTCAGAIILRSTMRMHDISTMAYNKIVFSYDWAGTNSAAKAIPVTIASTAPISGNVNITETTLSTMSTATLSALATQNLTLVKNTAGHVYSIQAFNNNTTTIYLKLYNKISAPVLAIDIPIYVYPIPAGGVLNIDPTRGLRFTSGIAYALVGGTGIDTDTNALAIAGSKLAINYI